MMDPIPVLKPKSLPEIIDRFAQLSARQAVLRTVSIARSEFTSSDRFQKTLSALEEARAEVGRELEKCKDEAASAVRRGAFGEDESR